MQIRVYAYVRVYVPSSVYCSVPMSSDIPIAMSTPSSKIPFSILYSPLKQFKNLWRRNSLQEWNKEVQKCDLGYFLVQKIKKIQIVMSTSQRIQKSV